MGLLQLQLGRIFYREDPFIVRDERGKDVQRGRLPGAGSSRDHDVDPAANAGLEEFRDGRRERPELDEVVGLIWVGRELPDREGRAVQRQRRDDRVDTRTIGEARVHVWARLVDASAYLADDLVDRPAELLLVVELGSGPVQLASALDVDRVPAVDHDLGHFGIANERLEGSEAEDAVPDLANDKQLLLRR